MKLKYRLYFLIAFIALLVFSGGLFIQNSASHTEKIVKIVNTTYSICTQDIPTSGCGPYEVTAQTDDGQKGTYMVAGFSNRKRKLYDEISSKLKNAEEQNRMVKIKLNDKNEIVSVQ